MFCTPIGRPNCATKMARSAPSTSPSLSRSATHALGMSCDIQRVMVAERLVVEMIEAVGGAGPGGETKLVGATGPGQQRSRGMAGAEFDTIPVTPAHTGGAPSCTPAYRSAATTPRSDSDRRAPR